MFCKFKFVALAVLGLAVAPLAWSAPDSGVLVTRVSSQKWTVRLISGAAPQAFAGVVETNNPINSTFPAKLEADDVARLSSPTQLDIQFGATPGTFDQIAFWTPNTSQICLRDTGGTGVQVYLGATLATAVQVSFPLALQGEDPCHTAPPPGPYTTTRKFHPGHYTALLRSQGGLKYMNDAVRPGVTGIMKRYSWKALEPTPGAYNFSQLSSDLAWAQSYGMQLIVMIEDKTFVADRPTPAYLDAYTFPNRIGGYTVKRWDPYVVERWKALAQALGRFDSHPNFEGIATQETAMGFDGTQLKSMGYTAEAYRDAYINMFESALVSLPNSRIFWYQNFITGNQSYVGEIAKAVGPKGVVMGGPDVLPDNASLLANSYPYYEQFKGRMHLFSQVEGICYDAPHETAGYPTKYWTPAEDFAFARDTLHANYMIWVRIPVADPADSYTWYDALPVIGANPTFNTP